MVNIRNPWALQQIRQISSIFLIALYLVMLPATAFAYHYEKKMIENHIVHVLQINPNEYTAKILKANNKNVGRETVSSMAKKSSATLAINAGFFEMGGDRDGIPTGTLVIDGKVYNLQNKIQSLIVIKNGIISIEQSTPHHHKRIDTSIISGIPMLLSGGEIPKNLLEKKSTFYTQPHARTALGLSPNGTLTIVVADHYNAQDISTLTLDELQSLIKTKSKKLTEKYKKQDSSTTNVEQQVKKEGFSLKQLDIQGFTILELAKFMKNLGCKYAINLDGGGSSTLWIEGKVINNTFGDKDESLGQKTERAVSNAIIFKKKLHQKEIFYNE